MLTSPSLDLSLNMEVQYRIFTPRDIFRRSRWYNGVINIHRKTSRMRDMFQGLNWRTLQDRRKDARVCMLYRIDRELVAIKKDRRLIPPHSRTLKTISCRTDRRKMSGTGIPYHQTYQKCTHSVPSRPVFQHCKGLEDVLLLTIPMTINQFKLYLDLVTLMEELFLMNALPSLSIIFNKLKEASKRQKQKIFKINDKLFLTLGKQDPASSDKYIFKRYVLSYYRLGSFEKEFCFTWQSNVLSDIFHFTQLVVLFEISL